MYPDPTSTIDATLAAAGSKATYAGGAATVGGWLLSSEGAAFCGIVIAALGLAVNFYFKRREDKRLQAEHEARMGEILRDMGPR